MADSDPLAALRRQRQLLTEELARLDREIAAAEDASSNAVYSGFTPPGAFSAPELPGDTAALPSDPIDPRTVHNSVRRGCLVYFALALLALAGALVAFYLLHHRA